MERADAERLVERTLEKVQHSAPAVLLRRHLKASSSATESHSSLSLYLPPDHDSDTHAPFFY